MRILFQLTAMALLTAATAAQSTTTEDVGLTVIGNHHVAGQTCGPVPCLPLPGGGLVRGFTYYLTHNAAPTTPFAMAIGLPTSTCLPLPGIANGLLLGTPITVLATGITSPAVTTLMCPRGAVSVTFPVPATAPAAFAFQLQSIGVSWSGQLGFSPAIAAVTQ